MAKKKDLTSKVLWFIARQTVKGVRKGAKGISRRIKKAKVQGITPVNNCGVIPLASAMGI